MHSFIIHSFIWATQSFIHSFKRSFMCFSDFIFFFSFPSTFSSDLILWWMAWGAVSLLQSVLQSSAIAVIRWPRLLASEGHEKKHNSLLFGRGFFCTFQFYQNFNKNWLIRVCMMSMPYSLSQPSGCVCWRADCLQVGKWLRRRGYQNRK